MIVVDTNVLLDNPEILLNDTEDFAISYVTLSELDGLKSNPDLNYPARTAIKIIHNLFKENKIKILNVPEENKTNDEKIVQDCKAINGILMSQDIGALVVAKARGVETYEMNSLSKEYDKTFKGYEEYYLDSKFYYRLTQNEYQIDEIEIPLEPHTKGESIPINSYLVFYPFGESSNNYMVWKKTKDKYILIPQGTKHLRSAGIGLDWIGYILSS